MLLNTFCEQNQKHNQEVKEMSVIWNYINDYSNIEE